ncbi:MAG TPA: SsrA-binding protein SmpB [Anaerolineae bacterium]|nr:SsrA-binding protein SmpB [Caldilineae bacterium]HID33982.1 SsrA-binding protein SmpB [Anaerolineae bacterium]
MGIKVVATNRKARHDYEILETMEAGIVLTGTEIKSVREGKVSLKEGFAIIKNGEVWLMDVNIAPYRHGHRDNHEPRRPRKLLLHRREIDRLQGKIQEKGWTLIPLKMYLKNNRAKVELALVRGKKKYDKRRDIAKRDAQRELQRALKGYR